MKDSQGESNSTKRGGLAHDEESSVVQSFHPAHVERIRRTFDVSWCQLKLHAEPKPMEVDLPSSVA
jgi:hypothetical protein